MNPICPNCKKHAQIELVLISPKRDDERLKRRYRVVCTNPQCKVNPATGFYEIIDTALVAWDNKFYEEDYYASEATKRDFVDSKGVLQGGSGRR